MNTLFEIKINDFNSSFKCEVYYYKEIETSEIIITNIKGKLFSDSDTTYIDEKYKDFIKEKIINPSKLIINFKEFIYSNSHGYRVIKNIVNLFLQNLTIKTNLDFIVKINKNIPFHNSILFKKNIENCINSDKINLIFEEYLL